MAPKSVTLSGPLSRIIERTNHRIGACLRLLIQASSVHPKRTRKSPLDLFRASLPGRSYENFPLMAPKSVTLSGPLSRIIERTNHRIGACLRLLIQASREWGSTFGIVFVQLVKSEYQTLARRSQKAADVGPWALPWSVSSKKPRLVAQRYSRDTPILRHVSREACGHLESATLIGLDNTPQTTE